MASGMGGEGGVGSPGAPHPAISNDAKKTQHATVQAAMRSDGRDGVCADQHWKRRGGAGGMRLVLPYKM
ncbi:MAG TPA: hypothetical protein VKF79_10910, partial [Candidatus Acidoferrum sp.]|nr:hypothetical protein [Candidatus Acidoferrum sp.]